MYSLSMAFIIFIWTATRVSQLTSEYGKMKTEGTYLTVKNNNALVS